nr:hypothetical protein L203_05359 [Cryptococcus depauperatus CBS 7841]
MSLSDLAESPPPTSQPTLGKDSISLVVPSNLILLPISASLVGFSIGLVRGGSRARLRFLAENAHRQPTTVQGWASHYFYTKTRNYRVLKGSIIAGVRYAIALGGATGAYVLLDESVGWTRERLFGYAKPTGKSLGEKVSWKRGGVQWEDGAIAGGVMGLAVGTTYNLPRPLFIRSFLMGVVLGSITSCMQIAQSHIGRKRQQEQTLETEQTVSPLLEQTPGLQETSMPTRGLWSYLKSWFGS